LFLRSASGPGELGPRLIDRRIADVDPRRLIKRAICRGEVVERDRFAHRRQQFGDTAASVHVLLLLGLQGLAQLGDLGRLGAQPFGLGQRLLRRCEIVLLDRRTGAAELRR
jgi:hypothetical protein